MTLLPPLYMGNFFMDKEYPEYLDLSYSDLTELPDLSNYKNLDILYCKNNEITTLNNLPPNLKKNILF